MPRTILLLIIILFLSACGGSVTPNPTETALLVDEAVQATLTAFPTRSPDIHTVEVTVQVKETVIVRHTVEVIVEVIETVIVPQTVEVTRAVTATPEPTATSLPTATPQPVTKRKIRSASEMLEQLKEAGLPIGETVIFNAETDPNELLGRPGQYIGKSSFRDIRLEVTYPDEIEYDDGGTIEVFSDIASARNRRDYIKAISDSSPLFNQYLFLEDTVLLRLSHRLTPAQAAEYESILREP